MALVQLVFQSEKTELFDAAEFRGETKRFRSRNTELGVTGIVVSHGRNFTALLEGREKVLFSLMEKIASDKRHTHVAVLFEEIIERARFINCYFGEFTVTGTRADGLTLGNRLAQCLRAAERHPAAI